MNASARLSDRHISDRFLPDKAIDCIDEAAAQLRTAFDSLPPELDTIERKVRTLEIERGALIQEDEEGHKERLNKIAGRLADLNEEGSGLRARWKQEKDVIQSIRAAKAHIEPLRAEADRLERSGELEKVGQIRFSDLPEAEKNLEQNTAELETPQEHGALLPEAVSEESIAQVIARWTGIPAAKLVETERAKPLHMEDRLHERVIGQDVAITAISQAVRRKPHSVILLGEVEKAHPDVFNVLLQLLADGRLTDGQGRTVDLRRRARRFDFRG